jgi:hypothetical protein
MVATPEADLDTWLEYFEHYAQGKEPDDEFARIIQLLEAEKITDPTRRRRWRPQRPGPSGSGCPR